MAAALGFYLEEALQHSMNGGTPQVSIFFINVIIFFICLFNFKLQF